jgi:hypothetical protein
MNAVVRVILLLVYVLAAQGCQTIGVGTVTRDRADYGAAIADSWKEQTLLNIIKLRYFDTPTFLDISSVISSYQVQGEIGFAREIFPRAPQDSNRAFGLSGTYTDRPTISYAPLSGEKFVNSLLRPIPPQAIFAMILSGHQADFILRATVRAINDVYNHTSAPSRAKQEDPAFAQVVVALRRIQQAGALGMRVEQSHGSSGQGGVRIEIQQSSARGERQGRGDITWVFFRENAGAEVDADIRFVREALGVAPDVRELRLTFGSLRSDGSEIALFTRSIMEILVELSAGVEVPQQHLAEGRARDMTAPAADTDPRMYPVARIRVSSERPQDAFSAVQYRNHWFWIDDRDLASKRVFTFLRMFSSIAETGVTPQLPVLTIPAN